MKIGKITILVSLIGGFAFGQAKEKILLEWKIAKNDTLHYKTTMDVVRTENENDKKNDSSSLFSQSEFRTMFKSITDINSGLKYQTDLYVNSRNEKLIDIEMKIINDANDATNELSALMSRLKDEDAKGTKKGKRKKKKEEQDKIEPDSLTFKNMVKNIASLNNNVVLRGRVSNTGELISSYYKNSQKNLIAILFELPGKTVEVGEKWKVNANLIEMDQNFLCDSVSNRNSVYIEKIIDVNNDRIAVIKYDISEYVSGDFNSPFGEMFTGETGEKTVMKMSHTATGNFSISKGRWISYKGEMEIENNMSVFGGKTTTVFELAE